MPVSQQIVNVSDLLRDAAVRLDLKSDEEYAAARGLRTRATYPGLSSSPGTPPEKDHGGNLRAKMLEDADLADARGDVWRLHGAYAREGTVVMDNGFGPELAGDREQRDRLRQAWKDVIPHVRRVVGEWLFNQALVKGNRVCFERPKIDDADRQADREDALLALNDGRVQVMNSRDKSRVGKVYVNETEARAAQRRMIGGS